MPHRIVEEDGRPRSAADLHRPRQQALPVRLQQRLVASGDEGEVALVRGAHVAQVVADFQLQQRDVRLEVAEAVLDPVDVPAPPVVVGGLDLVEGVRRVQVRPLVEESVDVGHDRPVVEHLQKEGVLVEQVHDPRVGPVEAVGEGGFVLPPEPGRAAALDGPLQGRGERLDPLRGEEVLQHEVAVVVEEEALGAGGMV